MDGLCSPVAFPSHLHPIPYDFVSVWETFHVAVDGGQVSASLLFFFPFPSPGHRRPVFIFSQSTARCRAWARRSPNQTTRHPARPRVSLVSLLGFAWLVCLWSVFFGCWRWDKFKGALPRLPLREIRKSREVGGWEQRRAKHADRYLNGIDQ